MSGKIICPMASCKITCEQDSLLSQLRWWWYCEWDEVVKPAIKFGLALGIVLTMVMVAFFAFITTYVGLSL